MSEKIIIIGATSGLGRALAVEMHLRGYIIGATGRRTERLNELSGQLKERIFVQPMDISKPKEAFKALESLIKIMGGMDVMVLNAGISNFQGQVNWQTERTVIDVNIRGFSALANYAFDFFEQQKSGHIVGVSSVAGLFGYGLSPTYNASKAYISNYLRGYRQRANHSNTNITITELQPGFAESEMTAGKKNMFWVAKTETAARQMADAIEAKRNHAYITKRWRLVAWAIKLLPNWVWDRL